MTGPELRNLVRDAPMVGVLGQIAAVVFSFGSLVAILTWGRTGAVGVLVCALGVVLVWALLLLGALLTLVAWRDQVIAAVTGEGESESEST